MLAKTHRSLPAIERFHRLHPVLNARMLEHVRDVVLAARYVHMLRKNPSCPVEVAFLADYPAIRN